MSYFLCFLGGVLIAWPIAVVHGIDLERKRWRR